MDRAQAVGREQSAGGGAGKGRPRVPGTRTTRYTVDAVAKALRVLEVFVNPPHRFSLTELSVRTGMSKNQTFRLLYTLTEAGFVRHDTETKLYSLGVRVFQLAGALLGSDDLLLAAAPVMDWARDATGETVNLIARDGETGAVCVDKRESRWHLQITAKVGTRFHLHAGASPKLLLAFSDDAVIERYLACHQPLPALSPATITDSAMLWEEIRAIREQGFAVSDEDLDLGACAIAAPIRNRYGEIVAGISIASPASRFGPAERERNRGIAVEAAERISHNLGYGAARAGPGSRTGPTRRGVAEE